MKVSFTALLFLLLSTSLFGQSPQKLKVFGNEPLPLSSAQLEQKLVEENTLLKLKKLSLDEQMKTRMSVEETLQLKLEIETLDQTVRNNQRIMEGKAVQLGLPNEDQN